MTPAVARSRHRDHNPEPPSPKPQNPNPQTPLTRNPQPKILEPPNTLNRTTSHFTITVTLTITITISLLLPLLLLVATVCSDEHVPVRPS